LRHRQKKAYSAGPLIIVALLIGGFILIQSNQDVDTYSSGTEFNEQEPSRELLASRTGLPLSREGRITGADGEVLVCSSDWYDDWKKVDGNFGLTCIDNNVVEGMDIAMYDENYVWIQSKSALKGKNACFQTLASEHPEYIFEIYYCHPPKVQSTCKDSDLGRNPWSYGTVTGIGGDGKTFSSSDSCNGNSLIERYCDGNNEPATYTDICDNGCEKGACITDAQAAANKPAVQKTADAPKTDTNQQASSDCGIYTTTFEPSVVQKGRAANRVPSYTILDPERNKARNQYYTELKSRVAIIEGNAFDRQYYSTLKEYNFGCVDRETRTVELAKIDKTLETDISDMFYAGPNDKDSIRFTIKTSRNEYFGPPDIFGNFGCNNDILVEWDRTYIKDVKMDLPRDFVTPRAKYPHSNNPKMDSDALYSIRPIGNGASTTIEIEVETTSETPDDTEIILSLFDCNLHVEDHQYGYDTIDSKGALTGGIWNAVIIPVYESRNTSGQNQITSQNQLRGEPTQVFKNDTLKNQFVKNQINISGNVTYLAAYGDPRGDANYTARVQTQTRFLGLIPVNLELGYNLDWNPEVKDYEITREQKWYYFLFPNLG